MASTLLSPTIQDPVYNCNNIADETLTAWHLVKRTATGVALAGAGVDVYGVVVSDAASAAYTEVATDATLVTCECSGTVTKGEAVKSATGGKIATASSADTACGIAEQTGTNTYITFRPLTFKAA